MREERRIVGRRDLLAARPDDVAGGIDDPARLEIHALVERRAVGCENILSGHARGHRIVPDDFGLFQPGERGGKGLGHHCDIVLALDDPAHAGDLCRDDGAIETAAEARRMANGVMGVAYRRAARIVG